MIKGIYKEMIRKRKFYYEDLGCQNAAHNFVAGKLYKDKTIFCDFGRILENLSKKEAL